MFLICLAVGLADGVTARCADRVTWVSSFGGTAEISGQERLTIQDGTGMLPLAPDGWLRAVGAGGRAVGAGEPQGVPAAAVRGGG